MPQNSFGFALKAISLREVLSRLSDGQDTRTFREASIQVDKLERMANAFNKKFGLRAELSMPAAKLKKKRGAELHRLSQQSKRLDALMIELFEWTLRQMVSSRNPSKALLKRLPMLAKISLREFNQSIHKSAEEALMQLPSGMGVKRLTE
jgi:glutamine synthetase adenylyltransferase